MRRGVTVPWPDAAQCQCGMTTPHPEAGARSADRPLRVLHVPGATGGHPQGLARAERELGLDSHSIVFEASPFGYEADQVVLGPNPSLAGRARLEAFRFRLLSRALGGAYDVVHYNFGQSLFPRPIVPGSPAVAGFPAALQQVYRGWSALLGMRDLTILRRRGITLFATFQGDDVRQADVCRARFAWAPARELEPTAIERGMDEARRTVARRFDRSADGLYYLNPDVAYVLPPRSRFVAYAHIDPREWRPESRPPNAHPLVVHAPTARTIKGTHHLLEAADALRAEGLQFDLELVEGRTQAEARRGLRARRLAGRPADARVVRRARGRKHGTRHPGDLTRALRRISHHVPRAFCRSSSRSSTRRPGASATSQRAMARRASRRIAGGRPPGPGHSSSAGTILRRGRPRGSSPITGQLIARRSR